MSNLFTLKNPKDNFSLIAFQYHTLEYSLNILIAKKKELSSDMILKNKINNYLMMERLAISQQLNREDLPFDIDENIKIYLKNNPDLDNYMNICRHIVAKKLDMASLCRRIDFSNHLFIVEEKELIGVNANVSTLGSIYNEIEKDFLIKSARYNKKIVNASVSSNKPIPIYNTTTNHNNYLTA